MSNNKEKNQIAQYLIDSEKTLSGKFFYDEKNKSEPDIYHFSKLAIKATEELDLVKKKKYYGKPVNISSSAPEDKVFQPDNKGENLLHAAIGIVTESGEILDTILKYKYGEKELDVVNIKEELGDVMWYFAILLRDLNIDFYESLDINISKLKSRYGDKFSSEKAINRNLDTERKILEGGIVITEDRSLENGGVKPPKNNWTSYADNIVLKEEEKFSLKKELLDSTIDITQKSNGLSLSDIGKAFGHLEVIDCSFVPNLLCDLRELKEFSMTNDIDLSKHLKRISSAELIPIGMFDFHTTQNGTICNRFIVLVNFDQMAGTLSVESILTPKGTILTKNQTFELAKYCNFGGIEYVVMI